MACNYLVDKALFKLWSSPRQDLHHVVEPQRMTPINGARNYVRVHYSKYVLPKPVARYHIYQIGQLFPTLLGLPPQAGYWMNFAKVCTEYNLNVNIYNQQGIEMPRYSSWFTVTEDRNLIVAIEEQPNIDIDMNVEPIFIRFYSGTFFKGERFKKDTDYVRVTGKTIQTREDIASLKDRYDKARNNLGMPLLYINGRKSNLLNFETVEIGDCVEFVEDTSVYKFVEFKITDLKTFDSIRDKIRKYLLHYATKHKATDLLDYHDDIDFYVVRKDPEKVRPEYTGFYYHRNEQKSVRNVTHRDYALSVPYVTDYTKQDIPMYNEEKSLSEWYIQMYVRRGGTERPVGFVHNRIHELYKLPDKHIVNALLGVRSNIPEWRADNLENSDWQHVVSATEYSLDPTIAENAFGYNAVSKMVGDTPSRVGVDASGKHVALPLMLRRYSSGWEYDADGLFLGYRNHYTGNEYVPSSANAEKVEMITGYGSKQIDETYNKVKSAYNPDFNYRVYRKEKYPQDGESEWEDVTNLNMHVIDRDTKIIHIVGDMNDYDWIVRSDANILYQVDEHELNDGLIYFPLMYESSRTGKVQRYINEIPFSELDVFLNGYSLVEGVDYLVDFPYVSINNKKFLKNNGFGKQKVEVRSYGFNPDGMTRGSKEDTGFVSYGVLSRNNRFDIRDDKVMRIAVGGRMMLPEELIFSESDTNLRPIGAKNGEPYEIKDILVHLRNVVDQDHFAYRAKSQDLDKRISAYMSQFIRDPVKKGLSPVDDLWPVFSPFISKILHDLLHEQIPTEKYRKHMDDDSVRKIAEPYEYLLKVDPTQGENMYKDEYVKVHPHHASVMIETDFWQYLLLERIIKLYMPGHVDLTEHITIRE